VKNYYRKIKKLDAWDSENVFYLKSNASRFSKFICHYEVFKLIKNTPGDIVECGVFRGASLSRFLGFLKIFNVKKKVYGFDAFGNFPKSNLKSDKKFAASHDKELGPGININSLKSIFKKKNIKNVKLIKGDVMKTVPSFVKKNKIKISLLHLDLDVYLATKKVLESLFPLISKNGIVLIDDYKHISNTTKAINEFLRKNKNLKIKKFNFPNRPSYILKK